MILKNQTYDFFFIVGFNIFLIFLQPILIVAAELTANYSRPILILGAFLILGYLISAVISQIKKTNIVINTMKAFLVSSCILSLILAFEAYIKLVISH
ncbi:hypothetical protein A3F66_04840 [candidate division TM6 bacterium RIFCSPHIGHO2_12_FULL_32_22]|nr:MAG: hypothetical protein A3F66_04840 [candidate division TM6 bacterium RIFCSPHIGHO2_12_FULL_32_22]